MMNIRELMKRTYENLILLINRDNHYNRLIEYYDNGYYLRIKYLYNGHALQATFFKYSKMYVVSFCDNDDYAKMKVDSMEFYNFIDGFNNFIKKELRKNKIKSIRYDTKSI